MTIGGRGSKGTALRLTVMPMSCRRSSACWPSSSDSRRSTSARCTSVPPVSTLTPWPASSSAAATAFAPSTVRRWRSRKASVRAMPSATALPAMTCMSGPPCWPGKTAELIGLACSSRHRIMPPRAPPSVLWIGGRDDVGVRDRVGVQAGGDQAGEVRHVDHEDRADLVGDLAEAREVQDARVGAPAGEQQLRPPLAGDARHLVHVDEAGLAVDLVGRDVVQPPRHVELHAVREVAAVGQRQAHDRVAGPQQRVVDGRVGLGARVRLDVGVLGAEQLLGAVDRQLLGDVDVLAAAVVAAPGIALGVLVGQHAALALEDGLGHEVLGGDHLERALLAGQLEAQDVGDQGIDIVQGTVEGVGAQLGHACDGTSLRRPSSRLITGA